MHDYYQLKSKQTISSDDEIVKLYQVGSRHDDSLEIYALRNGTLQSYRYKNNAWVPSQLLSDARQLYFDEKSNRIITKSKDGINFYEREESKLRLLSRTGKFKKNQFDDIYGWNNPGYIIKFGHFYKDPNLLGILTNRLKYGAKFYVVMEKQLSDGKLPIWWLKTDLGILGNVANATFALSDLDHDGQENIIVHGSNGLNIFEMNQKNGLERIMEIPNSAKPGNSEETLHFPNLTGQSHRDIALFNSSGLFVYQYNATVNNYGLFDYQPLFSQQKGWTQKYSDSIQFEDIDLDGRDDMLFTGPQGIRLFSFNNNTNQWESLLNTSQLTTTEIHSDVMKVLPISIPNTVRPTVFTKHNNELRWADIIRVEGETPKEDIEPPVVDPIQSASPPIVKQSSEEVKPIDLLRDHLDCTSIVEGVDSKTGRVKITLPLVDLSSSFSDVKLSIFHDGTSQVSNILGVGWSLPQNYMMMDHQSSIFPQDQKHFIVVQDFPQMLTFDPKNSTESVRSFNLPNTTETDLKIHYYKHAERWEVSTGNVKQIYGRAEDTDNDAIGWSLRWENWGGVGSSTTEQKRFPNMWQLTKVEAEDGSYLRYTYDAVKVETPSGTSFTRQTYMKTISDNHGNKITFNYAEKDASEYDSQPLLDNQGNLNTKPLQTRYLESYDLITPAYQQTIQIRYKVESGVRYLTEIAQKDDITKTPILQFDYRELHKSHLLSKAVLPTGAEFEFDYEAPNVPPATEEPVQKCDVKENHRVDYGDDFVLVSYVNEGGRVVLRMFNQEMTKETYSTGSFHAATRFPRLGRSSVKLYDIAFMQDSLAFILSYQNVKELCLLTRKDGKWKVTPVYYQYSKDAIVRLGKDFIVVADVNKAIQTISYNENTEQWEKSMPFGESEMIQDTSLFSVSGGTIALYHKDLLTIAYKNRDGQWQRNTIDKVPGVINDINNTLNKFELDGRFQSGLFTYFKSFSLQLSNNLVLLNRWRLEDKKMYAVNDLIVLNSNFQMAEHEQRKFLDMDLNEFSTELEMSPGSFYTIVYKESGNKFVLYATDVRGKVIDIINESTSNSNIRKDQKNKHLEDTNKELRKEVEKDKPVLFNFRDYTAILSGQVVVCKDKKLTFTGKEWKEETLPEGHKISIPLADKLILYNSDVEKSSFKLYEQNSTASEKLGKSLLDLGVRELNQTVIGYPVYLAYQQAESQVSVVGFAPDGDSINAEWAYKLPSGEKLSAFSKDQTLVTTFDSVDRAFSKTLVFRRPNLRRLLPNPVVAAVKASFDDGNQRITRVTGREYSGAKAMGNAVYYENNSIIPGNNKQSLGWVEMVKASTDPSKMEKRVFNSDGALIKTVEPEEDDNRANGASINNENVHSNMTLIDKTGKLEVAQFFPYDITHNEVGYYGFEDYEVNKIGGKNATSEEKWLFEENAIVKQGFPLTGSNYLSLSGKTLMGTFKPNNQQQKYVASCWVRPQNKTEFKLGNVVPYLKAVVSDEKRNETLLPMAEVKQQQGSWYYLEVIIDLLFTKAVFANLNELDTKNRTQVENKNQTEVEQTPVNQTVYVIVASDVNTTMDVDHVRFSPLSSSFQANVYDPVTKRVNEVIGADGLIERRVYDKYQKLVAVVNTYGELTEFSTYTKTSSVGRLTQLKSYVEIKTEGGFYENFSPDSFGRNWKIDNANDWQISLGQLQHLSNASHSLRLTTNGLDRTSYGIRSIFSLQSGNATIKLNNGLRLTRKTDGTAVIVILGEERIIPTNGELLVIAEGKRLFIWIDGGLYYDGVPKESTLNLELGAKVKISDFIVFKNPTVKITYLNALDEKVQEISMENENTSIVQEYLYDEFGRQTITTKPMRVRRSNSQSLLTHYPKLIQNKNPHSNESVWKVHELQGEATNVIGKFDYSQVEYCTNPLNEQCAVGMPGKDFSISGPYGKRFSSYSDDAFIENMFPIDRNYTYRVEHKPGKVDDISVFNNDGNRVAWYVHTPAKSDLLSTYEYDENRRLIKALPPLYHEKVSTVDQPNTIVKSNSTQKLKEEKSLQDAMAVTNRYDDKGNVVSQTTPDTGKTENVFGENGLLKFVVHYSNVKREEIDNVTYFEYDELNRLSSTGEVILSNRQMKLSDLEQYGSNNRTVYQKYHFSDNEREPILRGKTARTITYNGAEAEPFIEESVINFAEETVSKRIIIPTTHIAQPELITLNRAFAAGKLKMLEYPIDFDGQPLRITYQHDKLGRVSQIGVPGNEKLFASFSYNPDNQITKETHLPESMKNFTRRYDYNSAGFITQLQDQYSTEKVYYTENGYGGYARGDGVVSRTEFQALWHDRCDDSKLGLNERSFISKDISSEQSATCFKELKKAGYIDNRNHQAKVYYPGAETKWPISCAYGVAARQIQKTLGKMGFPSRYGHSYDYGNYQELTKAKYFVGDDDPMPLQPNTFAKEIPELSETVSEEIWKKLIDHQFLTQDNDKVDMSRSHSKKGKSFIRSTLADDLKSTNPNDIVYQLPLEILLMESYSQNESPSSLKSTFKDAFLRWSAGVNDMEPRANAIAEMLEQKGYFENPLAEEFSDALNEYKPFVRDIVRVMSQHFARDLGEAEFDVESYGIDANGNHKHFYTGFDRYVLGYRDNTNRVSKVNFRDTASWEKENSFAVKHDSRGNIIQAMHKGIENIKYHPVSNRATKIKLVDGRELTFYYDARGERVMKRVSNSTGETTKEIHYIRDETGRVLVEREITYIDGGARPDVLLTAYVYGPRGMLGFIRRNEFYSVISDHEGSVRLVVKGDEVVAAYDYLPYGGFMREYQSDPEARIAYRYTGQEWDEELGLYNYHARFYDANIGRFYQIDPKGQYFSPYKYAGNSPVTMVDPDGEFAILLTCIIIGAIAGAYLAAAAANNRWDPTQWDFKSKETWLGLFGGGLAGAFLPIGFGASVGAFSSVAVGLTVTTGMGLGGSYLGMAAANNEWNPSKWDLKSPGTWNAGFNGFAAGSGLIGGFNGAKAVYQEMTSVWSKVALLGSSGGIFIGSFVVNGINNHWDISKPGIYYGGIQVLDDATNLPLFMRSIYKGGRKGFKAIADGLRKNRNAALSEVKSLSRYRNAAIEAAKLGLKGAGVIAPAIALTALEDGLDGSKANTYFSIVRNMAMMNQNYMLGKTYVTSKKLKIKLKQNEQREQLFKNIAEDAQLQYKSLLRMAKDTESVRGVVELFVKRLESLPQISEAHDVNGQIVMDTTILCLERLKKAFDSRVDTPPSKELVDSYGKKLLRPVEELNLSKETREAIIHDVIQGFVTNLTEEVTIDPNHRSIDKSTERITDLQAYEAFETKLKSLLKPNEELNADVSRAAAKALLDSLKKLPSATDRVMDMFNESLKKNELVKLLYDLKKKSVEDIKAVDLKRLNKLAVESMSRQIATELFQERYNRLREALGDGAIEIPTGREVIDLYVKKLENVPDVSSSIARDAIDAFLHNLTKKMGTDRINIIDESLSNLQDTFIERLRIVLGDAAHIDAGSAQAAAKAYYQALNSLTSGVRDTESLIRIFNEQINGNDQLVKALYEWKLKESTAESLSVGDINLLMRKVVESMSNDIASKLYDRFSKELGNDEIRKDFTKSYADRISRLVDTVDAKIAQDAAEAYLKSLRDILEVSDSKDVRRLGKMVDASMSDELAIELYRLKEQQSKGESSLKYDDLYAKLVESMRADLLYELYQHSNPKVKPNGQDDFGVYAKQLQRRDAAQSHFDGLILGKSDEMNNFNRQIANSVDDVLVYEFLRAKQDDAPKRETRTAREQFRDLYLKKMESVLKRNNVEHLSESIASTIGAEIDRETEFNRDRFDDIDDFDFDAGRAEIAKYLDRLVIDLHYKELINALKNRTWNTEGEFINSRTNFAQLTSKLEGICAKDFKAWLIKNRLLDVMSTEFLSHIYDDHVNGTDNADKIFEVADGEVDSIRKQIIDEYVRNLKNAIETGSNELPTGKRKVTQDEINSAAKKYVDRLREERKFGINEADAYDAIRSFLDRMDTELVNTALWKYFSESIEKMYVDARAALTIKDALDAGTEYLKNLKFDKAGQAQIPNRAMAVGISDTHAAVAVSGNNDVGLIILYTHDSYKELTSGQYFMQRDNKFIAQERVVASTDPIENKSILTEIHNKQESIKADNIEKLKEISNSDEGLVQLLDGNTSPDDLKKMMTDFVNNKINGGEWPSEKSLKDHIKASVKQRAQEINRQIEQLKTSLKQAERRRDDLYSKIIAEEGISELVKEMMTELNGVVEEIVEIGRQRDAAAVQKVDVDNLLKDNGITLKLRELESRLTPWEMSNCAEPHVISLFARSEDAFLGRPTLGEIQYMGTYKMPPNKPAEYFPRCDNCVISTGKVPYIITDESWANMIAEDRRTYEALREELNPYRSLVARSFLTFRQTNSPDLLSDKTKKRMANARQQHENKLNTYMGIASQHFARPELNRTEAKDSNSTRKTRSVSFNSEPILEENISLTIEKAAGDATPHSFTNSLFGWLNKGAEKAKGMLTSWRLSDNYDSKFENGDSLQQINISQIDTNGTIMLLDMLIRKTTGEKHIASNISTIREQDARGYAINIIEKFEQIVQKSARKSRISMRSLSIDFSEIQGEITKKIIGGKYDEISRVLSSNARKACVDNGTEHIRGMSEEKCNNFMVALDSELNALLNRSIPQLVTGKNDVSETEEQQRDSTTNDFINNASVSGHTVPVEGHSKSALNIESNVPGGRLLF